MLTPKGMWRLREAGQEVSPHGRPGAERLVVHLPFPLGILRLGVGKK